MVIESPARAHQLRRSIPELYELELLIQQHAGRVSARTLAHVDQQGTCLPIYALELGSADPQAPALGFVGGVHGVERIGSQVIIAYLTTLLNQLRWDPVLAEQLSRLKLWFVPIVNPGGMWNNTRANPNGVDLMRNAPVDGQGRMPWLLGGQRLSRHLPWYRGRQGAAMEPELQALHDYVDSQLQQRPFVLTLDCHSGFGFSDRVWFPYARTESPFHDLGTVYRLARLFNKAYHNHTFYQFEPQASSYTTHGDLWDLLYDKARTQAPQMTYLPLTLELGSWLWVKKNPRQLFSFVSLFNPVVPHRHSRILRRHYPFFDFLQAATRSWSRWLPATPRKRRKSTKAALRYWYENKNDKRN